MNGCDVMFLVVEEAVYKLTCEFIRGSAALNGKILQSLLLGGCELYGHTSTLMQVRFVVNQRVIQGYLNHLAAMYGVDLLKFNAVSIR
jgi:hypothetical protein